MGYIVDKNKSFAILDRNGAMVIEDMITYQVRVGHSYYIDDTTTIASESGTREIVFNTPDFGINIVGDYETFGGSAIVEIFENPTLSDLGTAISIFAHNRIVGDNSASECYHSPTISDDGLKIKTFHIWSTSHNPSRASSSERDFTFRVLDKNSLYLVRYTALDGGIEVETHWSWHEGNHLCDDCEV